jgi:pilus assembly protein CpaE
VNVTSKLCVYGVPDFDSRLVPGFNVVATATVQNEVLTALGTMEPDVVLLDLDEPNSVGTILKIREIKPRVGVVGVTTDTDIQRLLAAQRAGCSQVVTRPLDPEDLAGALHRALGQKGSPSSASRTFAVLGTIGGAGATTVAAHLAIEIAQLTKQATALFDLDFECGGAADAFDLDPAHTLADVASATAVDSSLLEKAATVLPVGVHVFARPQTIPEAHAIDETAVQYILQAAQRSYPYVVLDLPRQLSPINGVAIEKCSKLVLVVQLTVPSLKNTRRLLETLTAEGVPADRIELVVNRFHKQANACSIETAEQQLQRSVLAVVPSDYKAVHCALDMGKPLAGRNPVRTAIREMATRLTGHERALRRA